MDENQLCYLLTKSLLQSSLFCWVVMSSFFHRMKEREDEGEDDGRSLAMRESGWCDTLVVVMIML